MKSLISIVEKQLSTLLNFQVFAIAFLLLKLFIDTGDSLFTCGNLTSVFAYFFHFFFQLIGFVFKWFSQSILLSVICFLFSQ